ncbi:protein S-acyltransferase 10 [Citrus sinensis]|uniref:Protein S-acyltransferase 10 n=1 Tax=Citrus sinensis TaxID=2711 RepID=A0ACB8J185_CITSI|nr:protein S-acyltransferase 10 [Citrus sinensis]
MLSAVSRPIRDSCAPVLDRCFRLVPCLADPARRSSLGLKAALVTLHLVFVGVIFLFDSELIEKTKHEPCYVLDAMRHANERNALFQKISTTSKQPASSKNGNMVITMEGSRPGRSFSGSNATSWTKLVLDLYPPGTSIRSLTCSYCNVEQPPRAKHCHDCDRCVLQFDHHCVWLGTCVGLVNHCRFWWFICEETALCLWTGVLYVAYLKANIALAWYDVFLEVEGCNHDYATDYFGNFLDIFAPPPPFS